MTATEAAADAPVSAGTPHISAAPGDFAPLVLMPGDPRRARRIAETVFDDVRLVTEVRGILGYTGTYRGVPMSVLASGMGIPSVSIYATELFRHYGVRRIVRVGTAGALPASVALRDVVIASAAHTDSSVSRLLVDGVTLSLAASYRPLRAAVDAADSSEAEGPGALASPRRPAVHIGPVFSSDHFYLDRPAVLDGLERRGTLAVEMEAAGLYAVAAAEGGEALAVLTVSDHVRTGEALSATDRETGFDRAVRIAAAALSADG
ncbi:MULTISPECIES: purine-nucleoside phosphorylase [unclassified Streptomyces]|uniref:purine-nucleoside phosphorylase n=1 Tax=unclassified Streptomyces TaxID=2593676 RepID=UPI002E7A3E59|nr:MULTISPECIES: purine-nucleoside phosphorylase [unclassified Streptomyces]MEE1760827.1 purine-nucleoside phosphorylase [Streptomyces sp. SP18BB07]MEE1835791.1 purine-nucleoside phosphorylase [Streptomyces sp. SP17KL33]